MHTRLNAAPMAAILAGATFTVMTLGLEPAAASCAPRVSASGSGYTLHQAYIAAVGAWERKVANTIGDLSSDWDWARAKRRTTVSVSPKRIVSVSGLPCNS